MPPKCQKCVNVQTSTGSCELLAVHQLLWFRFMCSIQTAQTEITSDSKCQSVTKSTRNPKRNSRHQILQHESVPLWADNARSARIQVGLLFIGSGQSGKTISFYLNIAFLAKVRGSIVRSIFALLALRICTCGFSVCFSLHSGMLMREVKHR